jgi:hypothetical protein
VKKQRAKVPYPPKPITLALNPIREGQPITWQSTIAGVGVDRPSKPRVAFLSLSLSLSLSLFHFLFLFLFQFCNVAEVAIIHNMI